MANISVKWYHSGMSGAPTLDNNWGDLVSLLDACLVNGFNLKSIDALTSVGGIATASISAGHTYVVDQVVKISGAAQAEYNGEFRVISITSTSFTYAVAGNPVSPASGAISVRVAPLNWEKAYSGTNKGAYRSTNPASTKNFLVVDNALKSPGYDTSWSKWANVGIAEKMTGISSITGAQAPYDPTKPTKNWAQVQSQQWGWHKWHHARGDGPDSSGPSGQRNWVLVGDDQIFFLMNTWHPDFTWYGRSTYCFGDIISFKAGDKFGTILCADDEFEWTNSYPGARNGNGLPQSLEFSGKVLLRDHTQIGYPVRWATTSLNTTNGVHVSGRGNVPFPNAADYSLWLLPTYLRQEDGNFRGIMPGMMWIPHDRAYSDMSIVDNVVGQPDRKFILIKTNYGGDGVGALLAFDITGPWR
jgi:hypothetical protein